MAEALLLAVAAAAPETMAAVGVTAGTATAAGSAGMLGTVLSGGLTAASAFGSIMGGNQEAAAYKAQAKQSELSARTEELRGREQADKIRRSLQSTLASQNAAFASRGIQLGSGTPVSLGNQSRTQAAQDIETAQFGGTMAAEAERGTAGQQRLSAKAARTTGYVNAATSLYKAGSLLT